MAMVSATYSVLAGKVSDTTTPVAAVLPPLEMAMVYDIRSPGCSEPPPRYSETLVTVRAGVEWIEEETSSSGLFGVVLDNYRLSLCGVAVALIALLFASVYFRRNKDGEYIALA